MQQPPSQRAQPRLKADEANVREFFFHVKKTIFTPVSLMFRGLPVAGAAVVVAEASGMSASRQGESGEHFFSGVKFAQIILGVGSGG